MGPDGCCCLLLFHVVCCLLLFVVVCCCLLLSVAGVQHRVYVHSNGALIVHTCCRSPRRRDFQRPRHLPHRIKHGKNSSQAILQQRSSVCQMQRAHKHNVQNCKCNELGPCMQSKHRQCTLLHAVKTSKSPRRAGRESTTGSKSTLACRKNWKIVSKNCKGTCIHCRAKHCARGDQPTRERKSSVQIFMCELRGHKHQVTGNSSKSNRRLARKHRAECQPETRSSKE